MDLFAKMAGHGFGEVHVRRDEASGLAAIIAIHDTRLGPALGGCRFIHYDDEGAAFTDALRLARGMTYKAAITGLALGGGKSVLIKPRTPFDRGALFSDFGRLIDHLGGRYITAEDSGTATADMDTVRTQTRWVTGVSKEKGGSGDPSPFTALGVRRGIEAAVKHKLNRDSLDGVRVAVQGLGHVGYYLCKELNALGAKLTVCDIDAARVERVRAEFSATVVDSTAIYDVDADVFAPCALGAGINDDTVGRLKVKIVAGAANNVLAEARHGDALKARAIAYAPDYAINAGGLVNVAHEIKSYDETVVRAQIHKIYDTILEVLDRAQKADISSHIVADRMAEERLAQSAR
ncbi:MAG: Glu/Leu/Phe/Val dehydrogenase dimerization domain-containing protein [Deltaproteobacteria bacterium]|nr:Glu/Leu/Phe/Val dehydrogenase dimerization domain-containing protein [Deltaproteobacteria bacterium]